MTRPISMWSVCGAWLGALALALWFAAGSMSVVAWLTAAFVGLVPPLVFRMVAQAPSRTIAQVIQDAEDQP
ncbi:MAG TPA: hypothetical protein VF198_17230 [Vicinamibacterales bacterium]